MLSTNQRLHISKKPRSGQGFQLHKSNSEPDRCIYDLSDSICPGERKKVTAAPEITSKYRKECRKVLANLTIMDDIFMRNVLKKQTCTEYILQIIMNSPGLQITEPVIQKDFKNLQGRSAILDCVVQDKDGRQYNLEIQKENEGATPKRARYHSGLLDMNTLNAGEEYDKLQESYVIFITRGDPLGDKLPIYHISRNIEETNKKFTDETHIIYVNSSKQDDTELGHLMHDLYCKNADDMYSKVLADRVRELKETQKGEESMCKELEELIKLGVADGRIEGRAEGKTEIQREVALALDRRGMQPDEIAEITGAQAATIRIWLDKDLNPIKE